MILNHLWGLYSHPQDEWHTIDANHENIIYSASHIVIIALVPTICSFFAAVYLDWYPSFSEPVAMAPLNAIFASLAIYILMIGSVFALAFIAWRMAHYLTATPTFTQSIELASYASTPLFMLGFCALYPQMWFITLCGCLALSYSGYLLFSGIPILIHVTANKRRVYSLSLLACGLVLLIALLAAMLWIWTI